VHKLTDRFNGITDILVRKRYPRDGRTGVESTVAPVTSTQIQRNIEQVVLDALTAGGQG
jgi:hypothetical protein